MAATNGSLAILKVSTDGVTFNAVGKIDSMDYELGKEELSTGACGEAVESAIAGREVFSGSASGHLDMADTNGQNVVRTALSGTCILHVQILPDGTNGRKCQCFIKPGKTSAAPGSPAKFSFSWRGIAASAAVP